MTAGIVLVGNLSCQSGAFKGHSTSKVFASVLGLRNPVCTECVSLDNVGSSVNIFAMDSLDHIRTGKIQTLIIATKLAPATAENITAVISLSQ